jgi:hypothetical protein
LFANLLCRGCPETLADRLLDGLAKGKTRIGELRAEVTVPSAQQVRVSRALD